MPNWCKGILKIRGKKENIINFLENGTSLLDGFWEPKQIKPEIILNSCDEIEIENIEKRLKKIITTNFNNDYSIDSEDKEAIENVLDIIEKYKNSDYETISLENNHLKEELEKLQDENKMMKRAFDRQTTDMNNYLLEMQKKDKQIEKYRKNNRRLCKEVNKIFSENENLKNRIEKYLKEKQERFEFYKKKVKQMKF